jgi:hypothetical protein
MNINALRNQRNTYINEETRNQEINKQNNKRKENENEYKILIAYIT